LAHLKVDEATVVAEIDGTIIERAKFAATALKGGQKIELIRFVGGG
jgi:thiamine biosynthesis protein ThiS